MDDYTWRIKMHQRRRRVRRERFAVLMLVVLSICGAIWYFGLYARTPEYAAKKLEQALEEKDIETFRKYAALELVLSDAYDDLTVDLFHNDTSLTPQAKSLFEKFYVLIKPQLVGATEDVICKRVSGGMWVMPEGGDMLKGRQLGIDYEEFLERSLLRSTRIKSFGEVTKENGSASIILEVLEENSHMPFTLELGMEKNDEGDWQVVSIKNYRTYLETVSPRIHQEVTEYVQATAGIVAKYNEILQSKQWDATYMSYSATGQLTKEQRTGLANYLENSVIPIVKKRQEELNQIPVPRGAMYLSNLRKESTDLSIRVWQHYVHGLRDDNIAEFNTAESLLKQMLATEQRIEDIIHRAAVSKAIPNMP